MKVSYLLSTVAYAATTGRQRRDTTCPTDWTYDSTLSTTQCYPSASSFTATCGQDSLTISFNGNHIYEDSKDWIIDPTVVQTSQTFATFQMSSGTSCAGAGVTTLNHQGSGVFSYTLSWTDQAACGYDTDHSNGVITYTTYLTGDQGIASAVDGDSDDLHLGTAFRFPITCTFADADEVSFTANTKRGTFETTYDMQTEGNAAVTELAVSFALTAQQGGSAITASNRAQIGQMVTFDLAGTNVPVGVEYFIDSCTAYPDTKTDAVSFDVVQVNREVSFRGVDRPFRAMFAFQLSSLELGSTTKVLVEVPVQRRFPSKLKHSPSLTMSTIQSYW